MKGFTLLEVLLAVILLTVSFLVLTEGLTLGLVAASDSESMLIATHLAQEKLEEIRNRSYGAIASETKAPVSGYSAFEREVTVTLPQANLKQVSVDVTWLHKTDELKVNLVTYVSNA